MGKGHVSRTTSMLENCRSLVLIPMKSFWNTVSLTQISVMIKIHITFFAFCCIIKLCICVKTDKVRNTGCLLDNQGKIISHLIRILIKISRHFLYCNTNSSVTDKNADQYKKIFRKYNICR